MSSRKKQKGNIFGSLFIGFLVVLAAQYVFFGPKSAIADTIIRFDEGYGASANDSNQSVTSGTITNAVWKSEDLCRYGKCMYFDGTGDLVSFADNANLDMTAKDTVTIHGWFRTPDITSGTRVLVAKHNATAGGYKIYMDSNGYLIFGIDDDSTWGPADTVSTSTAAFDDNRWHFFSAVKNGTTSISLYVDGVLFQTDSSLTETGSLANADTFYIGMDGNGSSNGYSGFLDEIRVLRTARTASEIRTDFLGSSTTSGAPPVAHWKFDENTGTTNYDSTGYDNSLTMTNSPAWATGKFGYALDYNGTNSVSANFNVLSNLVIAGDLTIAAWIYRDTTTLDQVIVREDGDGAGEGGNENYRLYVNDTDSTLKIQWQYSASQTTQEAISTAALANPTGSWTHIAAVRNTATNIVTFYENGKQLGNPVAFSNDPTGGGTTPDIYIGARDGSNGDPFDGKIDDVRIYNYTRSQTQILEDMQGYPPTGVAVSLGSKQDNLLSNGLVGYWKMDETATPAVDSSGNGNNGTWTNSPVSITGKYGNGVYFDTATTNKYINVPAATSINNLSAFTISTWVNPAELVDNTSILSKGGAMHLYFENISSSMRTQFSMMCSGDDMAVLATSADSMSLTTWHHIVVTWDGSGCAMSSTNVYIDGKLIEKHANSVDGTGTRNSDSGTNLSIGNDSNSLTTRQIQGSMDETRLYNRALSSAEVSQLYKFAPGPIAHWRLDENNGTTVYDSSGNGYNSTSFAGQTKWSAGKYGSSVSFDGSNDYVDFVDADAFSINTTNMLTVSAWIKPTSYSATHAFISKNNYTGDQTEWEFRLHSDGSVNVFLFNNVGGDYMSAQEYTPATLNTWQHVTFVADLSIPSLKLYVNGAIGDVIDLTASGTYGNRTASVRIGENSFGNQDYAGEIDDIRVYNYVRTQAQIIEDMRRGNLSSISYWKFDEGNGTTANDSNSTIGGSESLTLSTATSSWTNTAKFGKAFSAGGARRLSRADDPYLDFKNSDDMAISFWMKSSIASGGNPSATEYIVYKAPSGAAAGGYGVYANTSGQICFGIDDDNTSFPEDSTCSSADVYDNNWHLVTAVKTGASKLEVFVDAKTNGTPDTAISANVNTLENSSVFYVGSADGVDDTDDFNGDLDELQIFRGILSVDQIRALYNNSNQSVLGAVSTDSSNAPSNSDSDGYCPPGQGSTCTGPIGHWKLDENSGTASVLDSSGNGYTGTMSNFVLGDWQPGKVGRGLNFDGSTKAVKFTQTHSSVTQGTIEAWIYLNALGVDHAIFAGGDDADTDQFILFLVNSSNRLNLYYRENTTANEFDIASTATIPLRTWTHVAVTQSGSTPNLYINGKLDNGGGISAVGTADGTEFFDDISAHIDNTTIGYRDRVSNDSYLNGIVDDVKLYNYARTPEQLAWDYNRGGPVAWWKMDEASWNNNCSTDTVFDSSGNGKHGDACPSSTGPVGGGIGKINNGGSFDGVNDYVTIPDNDMFTFGNGTTNRPFSISAWIYTTDATQGVILSKSDETTGSEKREFNLYLSSGDFLTMEVTDETAGGNISRRWGTVFPENSWHHVVATYDGSAVHTGIKLYVDGVQRDDTNSSSGSFTAIRNTTSTLDIGSNLGASSRTYYYTGQIDDLRIYNYALNATQVKSVMNDGSAVKL